MMEITTKQHIEMFRDFVECYPEWAERVVSYAPKHLCAIRIRLNDGRVIDYNGRMRTIRYMDNPAIATPDDILDSDCRMIFGANLWEIMKMTGVGQAELAARTGLSSACISKYVNGNSTPSLTNVKKIAKALNCDVAELID